MEIHPRLFPMGSHRTGGHGWCLRGSEGWISVLPASLGWLWLGLWPCEHHRERARHGRRGLGLSRDDTDETWLVDGFKKNTQTWCFFWGGRVFYYQHHKQILEMECAKASRSENPWAHGPYFLWRCSGFLRPNGVFSNLRENSHVFTVLPVFHSLWSFFFRMAIWWYVLI